MVGVALLLGGCGTLGYYYQSATGHFDLMCRARDIDRVLADESVAPAVRQRLERVRDIRRFASEALALPDNDSYTRYADLGRRYAVWNVFAAPPLSTEPHQWCFPVVGCVVYRGYFEAADARRYAESLEHRGLETFVAGVPAYSTLGWFDDPLLSTVLDYPEPQLAGLIFHELAHQVVYARGDSTFNESFATAVEIEGVERWLKSRGRPQAMQAYLERRRRNDRVVALILAYRRKLQRVYQADRGDDWKRRRKAAIIAALKERYARLTGEWAGYNGYSRWFGEALNNAHFAVVAAYHDRVPAFQALLARHDGDLAAFYEAVSELAEQPAEHRNAFLDGLAPRENEAADTQASAS